MRSLLLGLAAAAALTAPAAAEAYTPPQLHAWQAVADTTWVSACAGRLNADVVPRGSLGEDVLGQAFINDSETCTYKIVSGLDDYTACIVTVHEAGHLAGLPHVKGGIMDAEPLEFWPDGTWRPCAHAEPPALTKSAALNWIDARWGASLQTLDCRRDALASRMKCWGRTFGGKRMRWTVWRDGGYLVRGGKLL